MDSTEKNATILFADIVDSSRLYSELGDEVAQPLIAQGLDLLTDIVTQYYGKVIKTIGDEVLATFDSTTHAAEAALFMQKMITGTSFGPDKKHLNIKIGLHAGTVIWQEGDVFGNSVNVAARLVAQAKPKQILISKATLHDVDKSIPLISRHIDTMKLKGIQDAIEVYDISSNEDEGSQTITLATEISGALDEPEKNLALTLKFNKKSHLINAENTTLKFGRDETNHVIVDQPSASRFHARIDYEKGRFILVDQSTNGTYVKQSDGTTAHVHRDKFTLSGQGLISLGQPIAPETANKISFRIANTTELTTK